LAGQNPCHRLRKERCGRTADVVSSAHSRRAAQFSL
jgi:hypothetical protein